MYIYICVFFWCGVIVWFGVTALQTKTIAWQPTYVWGFYFGNTQHSIKHKKSFNVALQVYLGNFQSSLESFLLKNFTKNSNPEIWGYFIENYQSTLAAPPESLTESLQQTFNKLSGQQCFFRFFLFLRPTVFPWKTMFGLYFKKWCVFISKNVFPPKKKGFMHVIVIVWKKHVQNTTYSFFWNFQKPTLVVKQSKHYWAFNWKVCFLCALVCSQITTGIYCWESCCKLSVTPNYQVTIFVKFFILKTKNNCLCYGSNFFDMLNTQCLIFKSNPKHRFGCHALVLVCNAVTPSQIKTPHQMNTHIYIYLHISILVHYVLKLHQKNPRTRAPTLDEHT